MGYKAENAGGVIRGKPEVVRQSVVALTQSS